MTNRRLPAAALALCLLPLNAAAFPWGKKSKAPAEPAPAPVPAPAPAADPKPDWLSGESAKYPSGSFVTGVGEGPTQEKAADRARSEVAKAFGVKVVDTTRLHESAHNGAENQDADSSLKTTTNRFLDGLEVPDYWRDEEGYYHALAVLNRAHSLKVIGDQLAEIDKSYKENVSDLDKAEGKFARLRTSLNLLKDAKKRRKLNENYRVLNPDGKGLPAPETLHDTLSRATKAVEAVKLAVEVRGLDPKRIASRMVDSLAAYGFRVVEKGAASDVVVSAQTEGQKLPSDNLTWYWSEGTVSVALSYGSTGEVFKRFQQSGQESALDPDESLAVVLSSLTDKAADQVYQILTTPMGLDD